MRLPKRDLTQLQALSLAPSEEAAHLISAGGPGVRIRYPGLEELVCREAGHLPGRREDDRKGRVELVFGKRIGLFREAFQDVQSRYV